MMCAPSWIAKWTTRYDEGGDPPEDVDCGRRHEYVWRTVDVLSELVQALEQSRKTVRIARGDLTDYPDVTIHLDS